MTSPGAHSLIGEAVPTPGTQMGGGTARSDLSSLLLTSSKAMKVAKTDFSFKTLQKLRSFSSVIITAAI